MGAGTVVEPIVVAIGVSDTASPKMQTDELVLRRRRAGYTPPKVARPGARKFTNKKLDRLAPKARSVKDLARMLGVTTRTVARRKKERSGPKKIGH
jgi:hypothetical protein